MDAETMWGRVQDAHRESASPIGARGPLAAKGAESGCLYARLPDSGQVAAVLADSPADAWDLLRGEGFDPTRRDGLWVTGPRDEIVERSPLFDRPRNCLRRARPYLKRSRAGLLDLPRDQPGVYRIHRVTDPTLAAMTGGDGGVEVYVGKSNRVRRRLLTHEKLEGRAWDGTKGAVSKVEVIAADPPSRSAVLTDQDLSAAEALHIAKMRRKFGDAALLNITEGGNGRTGWLPPHLFVWDPSIG